MFEFTSSCAGCDQWTTLDDVGLCDTCAAKFDRDLIRQRAWDYSATAFACDPKDYEALRQAVIEHYGPTVEKILPTAAAYRSLLLAGRVSLVRGSTTDTLQVMGGAPDDMAMEGERQLPCLVIGRVRVSTGWRCPNRLVNGNEAGIETAAATAVIMSRSIPPPRPVLRADHPFLFMIRENSTGAVLFLGKVTDPAAKAT